MKKLAPLLIIFLIVELSLAKAQNHSVEAYIKGLGKDTLIVEYLPISQLGIIDEPIRDTVYSDNNKFFYDSNSPEPIVLMIFPKKGEYRRLNGNLYRPSEKYIGIFLRQGERVQVNGELKNLYIEYTAKGSEINVESSSLRNKFISKISEAVLIELRLDTLMAKKGNKDSINDLFRKRSELYKIARDRDLEYIKNHLNKDLSAFLLVRQPLDTLGKYLTNLTPEIREGLFKNALSSRYIVYRKYTLVREAEKNIKEGKKAPDFTLKEISGKEFSLSSKNDKYIVLDFWGSWCGPCVSGFPKMKEYYRKYRDKVEFIGIACNDKEDRWKQAVQKNELMWIQVINNNDQIEKDVSVIYGISSYPTKIILDPDQKIIGRFSGEGENFYNKMDELFH